MNSSIAATVLNFCMIQLHLIQDRETKLRKEMLDCKIQREFLEKTIESLGVEGVKEK
jgi:hypothetical protein|tara:strand:+ start:76 stop:246 length:171 start_codon:yes stop_codon:yes gene_type:complete